MIAYASFSIVASTKRSGEKEINGPPLSQPCPPCVTPSSTSSWRHCSDARAAENASTQVCCINQIYRSSARLTNADPAAGQIRLINPSLPAFLEQVVLRNLQLGQSSVDLRVHRHDNEVSLEILRRRGQVQVSIVFT